MYPNILLSVFIAFVALQIIGGMVGSPKLGKVAGVLMVATVATAHPVVAHGALSRPKLVDESGRPAGPRGPEVGPSVMGPKHYGSSQAER